MLANTTGKRTLDLARRFPGKIGHLFSPGAQRGPVPYIPYGLDNERFVSFKNGTSWDEAKWLRLLGWAKASGQEPLWALVPDVVGDRVGTLNDWAKYAPIVRGFGFKLAFAVQDGMSPQDVPVDAEVIFVGGSTKWKWSTLRMWCENFPHVHVGRVNVYRRLWQCHLLNVKSVDGTGWMRAGISRQYRGLVAYLKESAGMISRMFTEEMFA